MTHSEYVPLRRLLERGVAEAFLASFERLMPGAEVALLGSDGRRFAGRGDWPLAEAAAWVARAAEGQTGTVADARLYPLTTKSQPVGALAVRGPVSEDVVRCLREGLNLFLDQALEKREVARETLDRYREINLLYRIGETIGASLDPDEIPRLELSEAQRVIPADVGAVLLPPAGGTDDPLEVKASFGAGEQVTALQNAARDLIAQVRQTGRPDILAADDAPVGTVLCAPLKARERVLGVVLFGRAAGQPVFTAGDEKLVMALTSQAAIAIEKAWLHQQELKRQRMEQELAIGRRIQLSLLPETCPSVPGWELAALYEAAQQVGGDYYDFFELPDGTGRLGLVIADVTGKGVPAALMMAFSRAIIRTEAMSGRNPADVLERANRIIVQDNRSQLLLSAFYATLDTRSGQLAYASGGHDHPFWLHAATGICEELHSRSLVMGAFPFIALEERAIDLAAGDLLLLYTDGVTEARAADGQMFGDERLQAALAANPAASAGEVLRTIVGTIKTFVGEAPPADDLTLVVVKRNGS
jgi:sigma-B regulation protein RsbU (phosphoserine phosphatase)